MHITPECHSWLGDPMRGVFMQAGRVAGLSSVLYSMYSACKLLQPCGRSESNVICGVCCTVRPYTTRCCPTSYSTSYFLPDSVPHFNLRITSSTSLCAMPFGARRRSSLYISSIRLALLESSLKLCPVIPLLGRLGSFAPVAAQDIQVRSCFSLATRDKRRGM